MPPSTPRLSNVPSARFKLTKTADRSKDKGLDLLGQFLAVTCCKGGGRRGECEEDCLWEDGEGEVGEGGLEGALRVGGAEGLLVGLLGRKEVHEILANNLNFGALIASQPAPKRNDQNQSFHQQMHKPAFNFSLGRNRSPLAYTSSVVRRSVGKLNNNYCMRIEVKDILLLFEKLQEETNIDYVSIVVFCGLDIDSLCTLKILSKLFRSENIQYKVYPVAKYSHLGQSITDALTYEKVRLFLMINCGAVIDLTETQIITRTQAEIFLFDIHKPVHHRNIESPRIKVVDDGHGELDKCPTSDTYDKMNQLNEIDLDSDPEDYDESAQGRQKREVKSRLRAQREVMERAITSYYGQEFFGQPSSHSAYQLVRNLNKANNDYLWFAIVGMTSMFLEQKLSKEALDRLTQLFQADAVKNSAGQPKDRGEIVSRKGFQFALLDHWSLYESMLHSGYLFAKMQLWQDRGLNRLHEFIHSIGISLQDARQLFKYMPAEGQRKLDSSIFAAAEKFGLLEVTYISFARNLDFSAAFMASDMVHVLTAVLEAPPRPPLPYAELAGQQVKCFWEAYDLLEGGAQEVGRRVEGCKGGLRVLMAEARHVMERDHLITTNSLSIANIRGDSENRLLFQHPSALIRLAYLLMAIIRDHKRTRTPRPLVANWIAVENELCLSVGVSVEHKNGLGQRFDRVTAKLGIEAEQDSFEANIIAFRKEHLSAFIKEISRS